MGRSPSDSEKARGVALAAGVTVAHLALFAVLGLAASEPPEFAPPVFEVELFRLPPPLPEPPPVVEPAQAAGGGAPSAPGRIHTPPTPPPEVPRELPAPSVQAPEPAIVVGLSPDAATGPPGMGQGEQGSGVGGGSGSGVGSGAGSVGPRLLRGPAVSDLRREHPEAALRARRSGEGTINCEIRLDSRLADCRLIDETPAGQGFGRAALAASAHYRFQPPSVDGRPQEGQRVTVHIEFGRSGAR